MRYSVLFDTLQNLIKRKPSQKEIGSILNLAQTAISGRANRDSDFPDEEIELIEKHYGISLRGNTIEETVAVDYYPEVFGSCGDGKYRLIVEHWSGEQIRDNQIMFFAITTKF